MQNELQKFDVQKDIVPVVSLFSSNTIITHTASITSKDIVGGSSSVTAPTDPYAILFKAHESNSGRILVKVKYTTPANAPVTADPAFDTSADSEGNELHTGDIILHPADTLDQMLKLRPGMVITAISAIAETAGDKLDVTIKS